MPVTDYFLLWKVTIPLSWIAAVFGLFLAWLAVRMKHGKQVSDIFGDAAFTVMIVWKLSVIVTDFETVRQAPMAILYFNGGVWGFIAGIVVAALIIFFSSRNALPDMSRGLLLGIVCAQSGYQVMMAILNDGSLIVRCMTVILFLSLAVIAFLYMKNDEVPIPYAAGLFVAAHAFIAALQPIGFTGIPFASTVTASVLVIVLQLRFTQVGKQMEGSNE